MQSSCGKSPSPGIRADGSVALCKRSIEQLRHKSPFSNPVILPEKNCNPPRELSIENIT
jgi:hypothetical protein